MSVMEQTTTLTQARRASLAERLKTLAEDDDETSIQPRPTGTPVRLSVDQYRIWLHATMYPELPTYNEPISIFHDGPLDPLMLKRALEVYACRHEAWRTGFRVQGDDVLQQIATSVSVSVILNDLTGLQPAQQEAEDARIAQDNAVQLFDLTQPPLFRAVLNRVSPGQDRLHLAVHHLIFDGTAIRESLMPELAAIYEGLAQGRELNLPPLQIQYADFALWREHQLCSTSMQLALAFWKEKLAGALPVARLPLDRPRPATSSQRGAMQRFTISAAMTLKLRALGMHHRATLYMVLLASLELLLFRYSGERDIVIGTASNGRTRPELQGMMGYLIDTFPIRVEAALEQSFLELLTTVRTELFNALQAAEVPFDQIVRASGAKRDASCHPLFQTFFSFLPALAIAAPAWDLQPKLVDTGTAKFDLYIEAEERGDELAACILYNTDLFDQTTIERMIGHWTTLLEGITLAPDMSLGALPLLCNAERALMLQDWNQTAIDLPANTVHGLFSQQVQKTPHSIAVQFGGATLTYAQLNDRAERFAWLLQQAGAGPGQLVVLCIDRSENLLAALLAILKTGATYLPLDPGTPLARIQLCLEDAEAAILLTQQTMLDRLPQAAAGPGSKVLCMEDLLPAAAALPEGTCVPPNLSGPEQTAYIIHTSGSTGRPKAVELPHHAVVNLLRSFQHSPGLTAEDVLIAVTTISFDIAVLELFLPIVTGARVVIAPRTTALDPFELSDLIEQTQCTVLQATPATWRALMAIEWPGKPGLKVLCGGEALSRDLAQKLLACGVELWNVYGPTETCIWSTVERVQSGTGAVPIGKPIADTKAYILDANQQPVPIGVAGELYLGGTGLAKGYRGQPKLTAEKFLVVPVANGERLYRTGDYALFRPDGTIECLGRADNQVKVRGYRIELEEVELHLSAYPDAASAAARVWKDEEAGNRLAGYIVPRPGKTIDTMDVRRFLQPRLPEYMIPTQILLLHDMPLTPNGKIDRKALPESLSPAAPSGAAGSLEIKPAEPLTEDEQALAEIWRDVLNVPSVARQDNFFALGGHSLLLVVMFARINRTFSVQLPLTTIFDAQTLTALAGVLRQNTRISSLVPVQTHGSKPPLFMAHSYLLYHGLSKALGEDQPFYGLRELETDGELSIEARALLYVADMRKVQPHGPYSVAGWCAAGPLAVEIARQLVLQGEQIRTLLLLDAWLPEYLSEKQRSAREQSPLGAFTTQWNSYRSRTKDLGLSATAKYVSRAVRRVVYQRRDDFFIDHWSFISRLARMFRLTLPQFMYNTTLKTVVSMRQFRADRLPVRITLLRATESLSIPSASEGCGWERVAGEGVTVLWVPGDHESMFRGLGLQLAGQLIQSSLTTPCPA